MAQDPERVGPIEIALIVLLIAVVAITILVLLGDPWTIAQKIVQFLIASRR